MKGLFKAQMDIHSWYVNFGKTIRWEQNPYYHYWYRSLNGGRWLAVMGKNF